ncbi:hypothetical protein HZH66_005065 [Vespula vulgaris]|uniref:Uncharacterized protein n=1 Tax=Vespula vulgaris TaxID=7454 RepID=A0A834NCV3_VESVU|nr:hypothetical protein HZH66_005065 [Vespula vulgaris]
MAFSKTFLSYSCDHLEDENSIDRANSSEGLIFIRGKVVRRILDSFNDICPLLERLRGEKCLGNWIKLCGVMD